jgi:hypothetical protein
MVGLFDVCGLRQMPVSMAGLVVMRDRMKGQSEEHGFKSNGADKPERVDFRLCPAEHE